MKVLILLTNIWLVIGFFEMRKLIFRTKYTFWLWQWIFKWQFSTTHILAELCVASKHVSYITCYLEWQWPSTSFPWITQFYIYKWKRWMVYILNVYECNMVVKIFFMRLKRKCSIQRGKAKLKGTFHLSLSENICNVCICTWAFMSG